MRRYFLIAGTLLTLALAALFALQGLNVVKWSGSRNIEVQVLVLDASDLTVVPNATVEVLKGPHSPLESSYFEMNEFQICDHDKLVTNKWGRTEFTHGFVAAGSSSLFDESGYVSTSKLWLRATAEGYRTTYMPVDRQSIRPRDIQDDTPICVTIPIGQISTDNGQISKD